MSPSDSADLLDRAATQLPLQIKLAETAALHFAQRSAYRHSSGTLSSAALAALGHPFARRHGTPQLDPGEVNVQTDTFRQAWETEGPSEVAGELVGSLYNTDPKAPQLEEGTPRVFARPIDAKIVADTAPERLRLLDEAVELSFR